jgi:hypothetical protein
VVADPHRSDHHGLGSCGSFLAELQATTTLLLWVPDSEGKNESKKTIDIA